MPAGQRIALTGTPVENRLSELWSIVDMVDPGPARQPQLSSAGASRMPIERHRDVAAAAALRRLTSPFVLRRTKADKSLVPDLPDKVEQIAWAPLTREQASMYQSVVDQLLVDAQAGHRHAPPRAGARRAHPAEADLQPPGARARRRIGARPVDRASWRGSTSWSPICSTPASRRWCSPSSAQMGLLLQRHLAERFGHDLLRGEVPFLHGGVPTARPRPHGRRSSSRAPASPLLLVSLKAGGTGLNLTAASRVVHYDRWWNPAVEDQATDRAWRIGQTQSVFVHKLVCQGTIEERVDALITDKRALAEAVVGTGTGEAWLSELSTDALRDLVVLDHDAVRGT